MAPVPAYQRIAEDLRERIASGALAPGGAVPSERRLGEELGVSRTTTRLALDVLVREGVLYRDGSRGTFVAEPRLGLRIGSFTREVVGQGRVPGARVLGAELVAAHRREAEALGLPEGAQVLRIERLRTVDDEPVAVERTTLRADLGVTLLGQDLGGSLWAALEVACGVVAAHAAVEIEAVALDAHDARLLGVGAGSPALLQTRRTTSADGEVFEWARDLHRGDRALLQAEADLAPADDPAQLLVRRVVS